MFGNLVCDPEEGWLEKWCRSVCLGWRVGLVGRVVVVGRERGCIRRGMIGMMGLYGPGGILHWVVVC